MDVILNKKINDIKSGLADLSTQVNTQQSQVLTNIEAEKQQQLASNYMKRIEDYANIISMPNNASGNVDVSLGGMSLKNELNYNRDTWAEWTAKGTAIITNTYLTVNNNTESLSPVRAVSIKPSTKYLILLNVRSNTRTTYSTAYVGGASRPFASDIVIGSGVSGSIKSVQTSNSNITANNMYMYFPVNTGKIELGDIRIYELPTGSQIETDANTLTADQLAVKYPYVKGDSTKNVCGSGKMVFKGKNNFDVNKVKSYLQEGNVSNDGFNLTYKRGSSGAFSGAIVPIDNNILKQYKLSWNNVIGTPKVMILDNNFNVVVSTASNPQIFTPTTNRYYILFTDSTYSQILITVNSIQVTFETNTYEPYVTNTTYIQAKENNLIVENRMLPNLIKDEFYFSKVIGKWKRKKNVSGDYALKVSDINSYSISATNVDIVLVSKQLDDKLVGSSDRSILSFKFNGFTSANIPTVDDVANIGKAYNLNGSSYGLIVGKGAYVSLEDARTNLVTNKQTTLTYQLATPIISDIDSIGEPKAYPSGNMSFEPCLWGYTSTASTIITDVRYPIKAITKVTKLDVIKGKLVETDVTADATISTDKLSIDIANIDITKSYFYVCEIDSQDSANASKVLDVEVNNGVITHDYGASVADWVLSANEANATMLVCVNAGGSAKIIAPAMDGKMYVIRNTSGQPITVKTASSTGIAIPNGFTETVSYTGSDYVKVAKDTQKIVADVEVNKFIATNLVINGDFSNGTTGWAHSMASCSVVDGVAECLANSQYDYIRTALTTVVGHKYYLYGKVKSTSNLVRLSFDTTRSYHSGSNQFENLSVIATAGATTLFAYVEDSRASGWDKFYFDNALCIDLTATFGVGNEPTETEMDAILAKFPNGWFDGTVEQLLNLKEIWNYMLKKKADIKQEDWITPTLLNGWAEFNTYTPVKFRKDSFGRVWIKGQVKNGTAGSVIFTLPSGYLPTQSQDFVSVSGGSIARIAISGAGNITLSAGLTTSLTLDNISFSVS